MTAHVVGVTGGQFAHEGHGNEVDRQPDVTTRQRATIKVGAKAKLPLNWEPVSHSNRWPAVYERYGLLLHARYLHRWHRPSLMSLRGRPVAITRRGSSPRTTLSGGLAGQPDRTAGADRQVVAGGQCRSQGIEPPESTGTELVLPAAPGRTEGARGLA